MTSDKFPEAFKRFEQKVNVRRIKNFKQLTLAFGSWAGRKWVPTWKQTDALADMARKRKIPLEDYSTREQQLRTPFSQAQFSEALRQQPIHAREKFSRNYSNFQHWQSETARTTAYQRRIINYMRNHPNATLAEARGHSANRKMR